MKKIILAGGSGFLGSSLAPVLLAQGYQVMVLTRRPSGGRQEGFRHVHWDGRTVGSWADELEGAEAVINLAGRSVNCRYTAENRKEINASRVDSVRAIGAAIRRSHTPPRLWVQASSLAIYGDPSDRWCNESAPVGEGFPVETCRLWEAAFEEASTLATRRVLLRIGIVLGRGAGGLQVLERLTRLGLGGRAGDGRQFLSWLHREDMNRIFEAVLARDDLEGVFNVCAPEPVTNDEFMRELRRVLERPWSPPVPVWAVHAGCWLMRTEPWLALAGRRCAPERLLQKGFVFRWPRLREALDDLYAQRPERPLVH